MTLTPTPTPELTPTAPASTAPSPPPTQTPPPSIYVAPALFSPDDEAVFRGKETEILLMWDSVGDLGVDDYYVVVSEFLHEGQLWRDWQWTKETALIMPRYMFDNAMDDHRIKWHVTVWRQTGTKPDGSREGVAVGAESAKRSYTWQPVGQNTAKPTPTHTPDFEG